MVPALEISPDVLAKVSTGKPIPPPVPSLFAAPTFEEALGSSLYNPNNTTNVYIRGLPPDTTDESLVDICERFGDIKSSKAIVDSQTSNCKGFGFVLFAKEADATACIAGLIYYGYQVSFAKESFSTRLKNLQDPDSTNLYLSNLPQTMHEKVRDGHLVSLVTDTLVGLRGSVSTIQSRVQSNTARFEQHQSWCRIRTHV